MKKGIYIKNNLWLYEVTVVMIQILYSVSSGLILTSTTNINKASGCQYDNGHLKTRVLSSSETSSAATRFKPSDIFCSLG
jgi:hypothetical protein